MSIDTQTVYGDRRAAERRSSSPVVEHDWGAPLLKNSPAPIDDLYSEITGSGLPEESDDVLQVARRERIYRRSLALADVAATLIAVLVVFGLVDGDGFRWSALLLPPAFLVGAKLQGLYDRDELVIRKSTLDELPRLLALCTFAALALWMTRKVFLMHVGHTPHMLAELWILLCAAAVSGRVLARRVAKRVTPVERCLVVGDERLLGRLERKLEGHHGVVLVGAVSSEKISSTVSGLRTLAMRSCVHRLIIAPEHGMQEQEMLDLVRTAKATGLRVSLFPGIMGAVGSSVVFDDFGGLTLLGVPRFGLSRSSRAIKRALDLLGASMVLVATAPIMAVIAVMIKVETPGPVFFRQTRVGRGGRQFQMLKFRSMVDGAEALKSELRGHNEAEGLFKIAEDPRITQVGRVLRRSHLDELPQLLNVLRGEMSLVGPRPLVVDEDQQITGFDRRRLHLTPGMTGPWQILGPARVPLSEMVKLDYLYVAHWSLWEDIKIMLQTCNVIVNRKGL